MRGPIGRIVSAILAAFLAFAILAVGPGGAAYGSGADPIYVGPRVSSEADPEGAIYVSPDGNDATATGGINAPFRSVNAALAAASPGDAIVLRGGTYREGVNVRVRIPGISIRSAAGEWAVIDLTEYDPGADEDSGVYFDVGSSGGSLLRVEVIGGFYAVCMETKWDWGDPSDRSGASDILIEDCALHGSRYDVVKVKPNCDRVTLRYNEIYDSGRAFDGNPPNGEDNAEGIDNVNGDFMTVEFNHIHDIRSNAIYAKGGASDAVIRHNLIERAYGGGILIGFDTSPEYFDLDANPEYYESVRCAVIENLIVDTGWEGIGLFGSLDAVAVGNTVVNACYGGRFHSAIYFGLTYQDWEDYAGRPANRNPTIRKNVVCQPGGYALPMIEIRHSDELGGLDALAGMPNMGENGYFVEGAAARFEDRRPGFLLEGAGLSEWIAHTGEEGSVEEDPGLNDSYVATNPNFAGMGIPAPIVPYPRAR